MSFGTKTIYIGDRRTFVDRLHRVLDSEDAVVAEVSCKIIGPHVIRTSEACLSDRVLYIDDDTYLGKSLTGPPQLVDRIAKLTFGLDPN